MKPLEGRRRRHGDRNDGFLVRNLDPMGKLIPFIGCCLRIESTSHIHRIFCMRCAREKFPD